MERSNSSTGHSFIPSGLSKAVSSIANAPKGIAKSASASPKSGGFIPTSPQDSKSKSQSKHSMGEAAIGNIYFFASFPSVSFLF
jgi:hypothetical protein